MDVKSVKERLIAAGIEVYRTRPAEVHVAERIRFHLMDSGIRVDLDGPDAARVSFVARVQRSDFTPGTEATSLFERVRGALGPLAIARSYSEIASGTTDVKDPVDDQRTLDTWHEVTYSKPVSNEDDIAEEVAWALSLERYVGP